MKRNQHGFTLVELSIVLVIIGLLIGGILVGQSLIESAKINAQIRQVQQYDIAVNLFQERFNQIPGDCTACGAKAWTSDNDGLLERLGGSDQVPSADLYSEGTYFFPDLYRMGLIPDDYGVGGGWTYRVGSPNSYPRSKMGKAGIHVLSNIQKSLFYLFISDDGNNTVVSNRLSNGFFSPAQAVALDAKMDDGNPLTGDVVANANTLNTISGGIPYATNLESNNAAGCINNNIYNTSIDDTTVCRLIIKSDFKK